MYQLDGRGGEHRLRKLLIQVPQQNMDFIQQHEQPNITAGLTQEQIHKMMQIIEEIRLKGYEETL
ncbi:hypothetical protein ACIQXF_19245 [Lysinibacillus sp. NPDC097231]|uniref:hypothetical protein n=1 Tax=Lysinibacillus sp. NPDC097231 TaxID=3364142 RepID=UPI00382541C7